MCAMRGPALWCGVGYGVLTESSASMDAAAADALLTVEILTTGLVCRARTPGRGRTSSRTRQRAEALGGTLTIAVRPAEYLCDGTLADWPR